MKNLWKMMLAMLVMLGVVACEVGIEESTPEPGPGTDEPTPEPEPTPGDVELSFTATIGMGADETRTDVEFNNGTGLWDAVWLGNETLVVSAEDLKFEFKNSTTAKSKFTCNTKDVEKLVGLDVNIELKHAAKGAIDSKAGKAGGSLSTVVKGFDDGDEVVLEAETAYLRYNSAFDITISASKDIFVYDGAEHSSVALAKGADVWVAVLHGDEAVTLTFTIGEEEVLTKELTINSHKVYNLGEINSSTQPAPEPDPEPEPEPNPETITIYLAPGVWNVDGAWFAVHAWGEGDVDVVMADADADGIYECELPATVTGLLFCRMNPAYSHFAWNSDTEPDHVWNQTTDLTPGIAPVNCYCITGWESGEWCEVGNVPEQPENPDQPENPTPGGVSEYGVVGSFQGWDVAASVAMYYDGDWVVARGIELYKDDEIKIVKGTTWDGSYGLEAAAVLDVDVEHALVNANSQNIKIAKNGKFDISFNAATSQFKYSCVEEYSNLTVSIAIDNKAGWSPLRLVLKSGDSFITAPEGDLIEGSSYAVSGDYIGSTLTYQFLTDGKQTEEAKVTISKSGAALVIEENVIKLTFKLDTDNSKQWWGETAKIHVWNTSTSFDTSWPGNELTYDGNYTWHIIVPSELVGKTINYLIHNGNGWQSSDSKITISASGNTVTGSSIGIN